MIRLLLASLVLTYEVCLSFHVAKVSFGRRVQFSATQGADVVGADIRKEGSFIQDELRAYAMKLHSKDQAPREGKQQAQKPFTQWKPSLDGYVKFLVDSLHVYETFDTIVEENSELSFLKSTGLERAAALREDIKWICEEYDTSVTRPEVGEAGKAYASFLKDIIKESVPKFMCHFYNHYFAHTAGGIAIGKRMSDALLGGTTLNFYKWDGKVKGDGGLLEATRSKIDNLACTWTDQEKQDCMEQTMNSFKFGGQLNAYMKT